MASILCVDDEPPVIQVMKGILEHAGHKVTGVHNVDAAFNVLVRGGIDLIISDYRMPGATGLEFLARLQAEGYDVPVVMVTGYGSIEHAVASIKAGAIDYITKPVRAQQLQLVVDQALEFIRLRRENAALREEVSQLRSRHELIGESPAFKRILETVSTVAPTRATVLLQGESGTGKELIARAIHGMSDRRDGPFIAVNCAAMPEQLVESMLFGHEKGAFTGAIRQVKGAFARANQGTLLLDEISEMRLDLQAKLLRVLQEQEFERVGGTSPVRVDVRIIATTNRDLADAVRQGTFREDLYYRLSVVPIAVVPLRERVEDIPILAHRFALRAAQEIGKEYAGLAPETIEMLQRYSWPGNVRELAHAVERAVILSPDPVLRPIAFDQERFGLAPGGPGAGPVVVGGPAGAAGTGDAGAAVPGAMGATAGAVTGGVAGGVPGGVPGGAVGGAIGGVPGGAAGGAAPGAGGGVGIVVDTLNIAEVERILIERALEVTGNNRTRAAELLGISVRTLRNRLNAPEA